MTIKIPSIWHSTKVVFKKEVRDGLRDWKAIPIALSVPAMGPLMVIWLFSILADVSDEPDYVTLPIAGSDYSPHLITWLEQNGITVTDAPKNPIASVRDLKIDMALVIPEEYQDKIANGESVAIKIITNSEDRSQGPAVKKIKRLIESYGAQVGTLRLLARGVNPQIATPMVVKEVDASKEDAFTRKILEMIPLFVTLAAFICSMMLAVDITAGERERGSIESLLLNPNPRSAFVWGKYLTAVTFSVVGLILTVIGFLVVLSYLPVEELGISISIDSQTVIWLVALVLPLALMASGLMILVSSLARSFKESQATLSFITLLPMIPIFIEHAGPIKTWMYAIPIFSQQRLLVDVLAGAIPATVDFVLSGVVSILIAVVTVWFTTRLFHKESFVFGR
ncbi:MAG: ABC transporter permease [Myxococcota bacterium]|nr:ABC transporter permease [Myxococcota bacterium]